MITFKKSTGLLFILIFIFTTKVNAQTVYVNSHGSKYHKESCVQLGRNRSAIGITEAQSQGYASCSLCQSKPQTKLNSNTKQKSAQKENQTARVEEKNKKEKQK